MADRKFTLLEYHSHGNGPSILPDLLSGRMKTQVAEPPTEGDDEGGSTVAVAIGFLVLVAIAAGVRYYWQSREDDSYTEPENVEVTEFEA